MAPRVKLLPKSDIVVVGSPNVANASFFDIPASPINSRACEYSSCRYLQTGPGPSCALLLGGYDPSSLQSTAAGRLDFDYVITADIWPHDADIGKVRRFRVEVSDLARCKQAAQADTQAMLAEIQRMHQQALKPAAAPAL